MFFNNHFGIHQFTKQQLSPNFPPPTGGFAEKLSSFHSSKAYIFNAAAVPAKTLGEPRGKSVDVFETFWGCDFPKNPEKIHTPIFFNSVIIGNFIPAKKKQLNNQRPIFVQIAFKATTTEILPIPKFHISVVDLISHTRNCPHASSVVCIGKHLPLHGDLSPSPSPVSLITKSRGLNATAYHVSMKLVNIE